MDYLVWAGCAVAFVTYFPLWKQIRSGKVEQNLFTWVMWATLDALAAATIIKQGGSYALPVFYAIGSGATVYIISKTEHKSIWTWFESVVIALVVACMVIWYLTTDATATVASTLAVLFGSIPQLVDAWKKPRTMPLGAYWAYLLANILCTAGAKDWSIQERFYPASVTILCLLFILFVIIRRRCQAPESTATPDHPVPTGRQA